MSRLICGLAAYLSNINKGNARRLLIWFTSQILLDTDEQIYEDIETSLKIKIVLVLGMKYIIKTIKKQDILILDEADAYLFDVVCKHQSSIRLTATSF